MWGSLSLGSIRDAATKLKDGLEAQMDEAMQQSGPIVVRAGPGATNEGEPQSPPGAPAGGGGGGGAGLLLSPESPSFMSEGAAPFSLATSRVPGSEGFGGGGGGGSSDGRAWNGGESGQSPPPSPPPRASRLGLSPPQQQETLPAGIAGQGSDGKGQGKAETARQRRDRLKRERAARKRQASAAGAAGDGGGGDSKLAASGKDKPRVRRLPTSPNLSATPATTTGAGDDVTVPPPLSLGQERDQTEAGRDGGTDDTPGDAVASADAASSPMTLRTPDSGSTVDDAYHGGSAEIGGERGGGAVRKWSALSPAAVGLDEAAADGIDAAVGGGGWGDVSLGDSDDDESDDAGYPPPQGAPAEEAAHTENPVSAHAGSTVGVALPTTPEKMTVAARKGGEGDLGENGDATSPGSAGTGSVVDAAASKDGVGGLSPSGDGPQMAEEGAAEGRAARGEDGGGEINSGGGLPPEEAQEGRAEDAKRPPLDGEGVAAEGICSLAEQTDDAGGGDGETGGDYQEEDREDDVGFSAPPVGEGSSMPEESSSSSTAVQPTVPLASVLDLEADEAEPGDAADEARNGDDNGDSDGEAAAAAAAAFEGEGGVVRKGALEPAGGVSLSTGSDERGVGVGAGASGDGIPEGADNGDRAEAPNQTAVSGTSGGDMDDGVGGDHSSGGGGTRVSGVGDGEDGAGSPGGRSLHDGQDGSTGVSDLRQQSPGGTDPAPADTCVKRGNAGSTATDEAADVAPEVPTAAQDTTATTNAEAAAVAAAREREDALTARLLVAEELLLERERQLESTNLAMAEIMQNGGRDREGGGNASDNGNATAAAVEEATAEGEMALADLRAQHQREVARLEGLVVAERKKGKAAADAVWSWETKAEEFEEKDKMLKAYMDEGAMLAFKQSEMEKTVRKARGELRGVQQERESLAKEKLALQTSLAGLREQLRAKDEERASQTQSLAAMGAVSQASSHRLSTTEKELEKTREALSAKKSALDKSWAETKELKRNLAELRAAKDALARSLEDGGKARQATESQLQQWQARESTLLLEQAQLQETLERVRREADRREDEAKERQEDVRRRWKEAVARAEALQAEAHESTAPLLRQVRSLQEEMRLRQEAVRAAEASLTDRASSAELACREAEKSRRAAEAAVAAAEEKAHRAEGEVENLGFKLARLEASFEESKAQCERHAERVSELEVELSSLKESSRAAALQHKATESKLRLQVNDAEDRLSEAQRRAESERRDAKDAASSLQEQLEALRRGAQQPGVRGGSYGWSLDRGGKRGPPETWSRRESGTFSIDGSLTGSQSGTPRASGVANGGGGGGGGASFAEVERLQSLARQKEGQAEVLQQRLEAVQATRDALTDEVTSLGRRNTELEALAKAVPLLKAQALELREKNNVLLDLLGEKTEDLEAVQADMREMQNMYREQYDQLLTQAAVVPKAST